MSKGLRERSWGRTLSGVFLLIVGATCLAFVIYNLANDLSIWLLGRRILAEVEDLWVERTSQNEEGELTFRYFVKYRFITPGGQAIIDTSTLDVREWGDLRVGGPVAVVYFPLYPRHNRLDDSRFVSLLACAYLPLILASWAGLGLGWYLVGPTRTREWWFAQDDHQGASEGEA